MPWGKKVVTLTPEQLKAYRKAVRGKTHAAFLQNNPEMQELYGAVKAKKQSIK